MSDDAQKTLNQAASRIDAVMRAVENFSGPKDLWAEWLVDGLEDELVSSDYLI